MFCCSDTSQRVEKPQPPLFPDQNLKPRPCMDHTSHCKRWIESSSENCSPKYGNAGKISMNSYPFMREVCQKSCSEAVDNFRSNKCKKYVSTYLLDFCRVFFL